MPRCGHQHCNDVPTCQTCLDKLDEDLPKLKSIDRQFIGLKEYHRQRREIESGMDDRRHLIYEIG